MAAKTGGMLAFSLLITIALLAVSPALAAADQIRPGNWVKYDSNPVLDVGAPGSWDEWGVMDPSVLVDSRSGSAIFHMWYTGYDDSFANAIGYAQSVHNGQNFSRPVSGPVLSGTPGGWDANAVRAPCVILDGGTFKMWYTGNGPGGSRIGYATSTDGIVWQKHPGNPVLQAGASGSWEAAAVVEPTVIKVGGAYHMWYRGRTGDYRGGIGYATSADGITWTKYAGNPVISDAAPGAWDYTAYGPNVIFDGSLFHMWYSGGNFAGTAWEIGYATSPDGIHWTRYGRVLPQGPDGSFDRYSADYASVMLSGGNWFEMWYSGLDQDNYVRIGYAAAPVVHLPPYDTFSYLPVTLRNAGLCSPVWFDPFSDYHSGWPIADETGYGLNYVNGEYRITIKEDDSYTYATPGLEMTNGALVTDLRFGRSGYDQDNGGIMFGKTLDDDANFYRFTLQANGHFCIQRHNEGAGWTSLKCGDAPGYAAYPASNRLKVVRNGATITGYVNGQLAGTVNDSAFTGSLRVGLSAGAAVAGADMRFDNYSIYSAACSSP